ncbi:DUF4157 domain-containing protein [Roseomonas eburnea]|uniref:DUF4157 domain-containing protein n=1 Tax=Neoroseomonas eburnea TaxID=1346889 RepID=A0A9X9X8Y0_9PROT|nr:DUF4157 domain-containing protein [Neoroseomonas eburnea]MBR0680166.1 DUF4157 domain-containing protein [Neoroseomonas eburnea]
MRASDSHVLAAPPQAAPPAFRIGAPDDVAEHEADAMADRALSGVLRRRCARGGHEDARLRRSGAAAVSAEAPRAVGRALQGPGRGLEAADRGFFGTRMGAAFDRVRVHAGPEADQAARSVGARAFALGHHLVFAQGEYRPRDPGGRRLLAHELAHTLQSGMVLRREDGPETGTKKEKKDGDVLTEGLKIVAEQAAKKEEVKKKVIEPLEKEAKSRWEELGTGGKAGVIGFGAAGWGIGIGTLLSTEKGRQTLSGFNLLAPTALVPGWPVTSFSFKPPEGGTGPYSFKLEFDGTRLLDALRPEGSKAPIASLSFDAAWTVDPSNDQWVAKTLKAKIGIVPGITLTGGLTEGPFLTAPFPVRTDEGDWITPMRSLPAPEGEKDKRPNIGGMLTIDFVKAPILPRRVREFLGGAPERKP